MEKNKSWTARTRDEDKFLVDNYSNYGPSKCAETLTTRTEASIKSRAQSLGLIYRQELFDWSAEEINILKTYYPSEGKRVGYRLPNRTPATIRVMAHRLGVKRVFHSR